MAARELLEDGKNAILCEMGSSRALVDAIVRLQRDPLLRRRIGTEGRKLFLNECRPKVLGSSLADLIEKTVSRKQMDGQ